MSEHLEVSFYILGDVIDDRIYSHIVELVSKMDGIVGVFHTQGTNAIEASANWNKPEFDKKIEEIQKIPNVKYVQVYKKTRLVIRSLTDSYGASERVSWNLEKDPIAEITRAKDARDYYKAISLSCTIFEYYGKEILLWASRNAGTIISKKQLKRLQSIIFMLYTQNIIDKTIYNKIDNVRKKLRNKLQHEDRSFRYSSHQAEEAEQLMINALDCVKFLKTKYDSINK